MNLSARFPLRFALRDYSSRSPKGSVLCVTVDHTRVSFL